MRRVRRLPLALKSLLEFRQKKKGKNETVFALSLIK
jgi:hypothetical protein